MAEAVAGASVKDAVLEDLVQGARVVGLTASGFVEVVAAEWHGKDAVTVVFRTEDGGIRQQVLLRGQTGRLRILPVGQASYFTGDPAEFKLGMEARRIQMAAQFDPMLAVATSDLDPLPHQIQAVYGDLLGKDQPLRRAKALDLAPTQVELATTRRDAASTVVDQRVFTSYIWVIFPDQPNAGRPMEITEVKAENQATTLAERVSERLHREGQTCGSAVTSRSESCGTSTPPTPTCPGCATAPSWRTPSARC